MVVLIVMKWMINWDYRMSQDEYTDDSKTIKICKLNIDGPNRGCNVPGLINTLINIALSPFENAEPLFDNQLATQQALLLTALCCVPLMLFVKVVV